MTSTGWDVAREAGVSQTTVSRTFRGDPRVAPKTRELVLEVASRLGYTPDPIARGLVTRRSGVVAVVVADITNPIYPALITTLHEQLRTRQLRMMLFKERDDGASPHDVLDLATSAVDGIVFASATVESEVVARFAHRVPAVLISRDAPGVELDKVLPDDDGGCRAVARHLVELGHRRIGMIAGSRHTSSGRGRVDLFRAALDRLGVGLGDELIRRGDSTYDSGARCMNELLDHSERPTAIFCASDTMAITAMDVALRRGVRIPDDVSLVGFDDIPASGWAMIDLTTVRQPFEAMARDALDLLAKRMAGEDGPPRLHRHGVELVPRGTTGTVE